MECPGWNKTWDEWVTDERLLKLNPDNLEKQKEVEKEVQANKGQGQSPDVSTRFLPQAARFRSDEVRYPGTLRSVFELVCENGE